MYLKANLNFVLYSFLKVNFLKLLTNFFEINANNRQGVVNFGNFSVDIFLIDILNKI